MRLILPWWASWLINLVVRGITKWAADKRAEQMMRDLGAKTQANEARAKAERQEAAAERAGATAADGEDAKSDLRP